MARKSRIKSSTGIYHVALRGQEGLFFDVADYVRFLELLRKYFDKTKASLYAYSFEKGKVHLAFYTSEELNLLIKPLCTSYARYINRTHEKSGKLFYDRYMSEPIEDMEYLYKVISFIHKRKAEFSSLLEYQNSEDLCDIKKIKKFVDLGAVAKNETAYAIRDNYREMSDKELLDYLMFINNKGKKKLTLEEKKEIIENALKYSNIAKSRLERIFEISIPQEKKDEFKSINKTDENKKVTKKTVQKIKEETKEEQKPQPKKQELSFWLL